MTQGRFLDMLRLQLFGRKARIWGEKGEKGVRNLSRTSKVALGARDIPPDHLDHPGASSQKRFLTPFSFIQREQ